MDDKAIVSDNATIRRPSLSRNRMPAADRRRLPHIGRSGWPDFDLTSFQFAWT